MWFDQNELRSGDAWDRLIRKRISECAVFVPMISASTQNREEGYFRLEWKLATDRSFMMADDKAFLFPVVIDDTQEYSARVPERFRERQWTRLLDQEQANDFAAHLSGILLKGSQHATQGAGSPGPKNTLRTTASSEDGFWIAVLPFRQIGANPELQALAEGFCEEILTGLSRFSYLRVIAHQSTASIDGGASDIRDIGRALNARYVMQGSLRQAGSRLRISAQVLDTQSGAHIWAENYDRTFDADAFFELLDELVPRIFSTVADQNGILPRSISEAVRNRPAEELSPYEAVLRSFCYLWRLTPEECLAGQAVLKQALEQAPGYANAWAMLAFLCGQAHAQQFDPKVDFLTQALSAARRAVDAGPSNHITHFSLAQALYFEREYESFRNSALRAVELNPMDGNAIAFMGELLSYSGDLELGLQLADAAKQLNPNHPGWYWITDFYHAYTRKDYRGALSCAFRIELPEHWGTQLMLAAAHGQLGETKPAAIALKRLESMRPGFAKTIRVDLERWFGASYTAHLIEGLEKAGFKEP